MELNNIRKKPIYAFTMAVAATQVIFCFNNTAFCSLVLQRRSIRIMKHVHPVKKKDIM